VDRLDVWAHKYNLLGLISYMRYTGNLEPLPACRRMGDLLERTFGDTPVSAISSRPGNMWAWRQPVFWSPWCSLPADRRATLS